VAFAATMVRYSNYSYEPSLGRRASAGKEDIHDFPVAQTIISPFAYFWRRFMKLPHQQVKNGHF
jgi:hypothetical protein